MSEIYLLPCECGDKLPVETTQAGQELTCSSCGTQIEVPSFSSIKRLEKAEPAENSDSDKKKAPARKRGTLQALVFALGFVVLIGGLVSTAVFYMLWTKFHAEPPPLADKAITGVTYFVEDASPARLDVAWRERVITDVPNTDSDKFKPHPYHTHKLLFENYRKFTFISAAIAGAGLLLVFGSFLVPAPTAKRKRTPARRK